MAMKKCIILFMAAILASCSDTQLAESIADVKGQGGCQWQRSD